MVSSSPLSAPLCLSGGATGSDACFGKYAALAGHTVIHWSFKGARVHVPNEEVVHLEQSQLNEANPFLERANATLGRHLDFNAYWIALLQRNYFQVKDATSVYAVSQIKAGLVQGGTAWATQMYIDQNDGKSCPCFVFDQIAQRWFVWSNSPVVEQMIDDPLIASETVWKGRWTPIDTPPPPTGVYAGIGSRKLLKSGESAIRSLLAQEVRDF